MGTGGHCRHQPLGARSTACRRAVTHRSGRPATALTTGFHSVQTGVESADATPDWSDGESVGPTGMAPS